MANSELIHYIKTVQAQGFSEAVIREALAKNGWQHHDVDEAYRELYPVATPAGLPSMPAAPGVLDETGDEHSSFVENHTFDYNSPYSIGLAIVLFGALMVLINKIIDDSGTFTANANGKLIFDAFLIIPFLIVAFLLHGSFQHAQKRYLIISQPYFIVAAFLLVRLLWDTSAYILNTNATYGVYVVLIMIIAVLTGIILFVQKYIKS